MGNLLHHMFDHKLLLHYLLMDVLPHLERCLYFLQRDHHSHPSRMHSPTITSTAAWTSSNSSPACPGIETKSGLQDPSFATKMDRKLHCELYCSTSYVCTCYYYQTGGTPLPPNPASPFSPQASKKWVWFVVTNHIERCSPAHSVASNF